MKTLLRHKQSGLYFQSRNNWTSNPQSAYDFRFIDRALQYVETWELKNVDLAFAFDDPPSVTTVSVARSLAHYVISA